MKTGREEEERLEGKGKDSERMVRLYEGWGRGERRRNGCKEGIKEKGRLEEKDGRGKG